MQILIVDTDERNQSGLRDILSKGGYHRIQIVESIAEAVEIREAVDLILLDSKVAGWEDISACRHLKLTPQFQDCPIIVLTNQPDPTLVMKAFSDGACDYIRKPVDSTELLGRVRAALNLKFEIDRRKAREKELIDLTTLLREMNRNLAEVSTLDALTNVANRRRFDEYLEQEWKRAKRGQETFSLAFADIDYFKDFNDAYGHQAGDRCLQSVAKALQDSMSRPADLLTRYGGEEFAAILPATNAEGAHLVAERMRISVEALNIPHTKSKISPMVSISVGVITVVSSHLLPSSELVARADEALYTAKEQGRNRVVQVTLDQALQNFHRVKR